jgi:hypothetical protein
MMNGGQSTLNKHGMKPAHLRGQQHPVVSGLAGQETLQKQLERGSVRFKRGIVRFTEEGVVLRDKDGNEESEVTPIDAVIFATGYRQQAGFVDPKVCDMRFERQGNDVELWKGVVPLSEYHGLSFINFIQSLTFMCGECVPKCSEVLIVCSSGCNHTPVVVIIHQSL